MCALRVTLFGKSLVQCDQGSPLNLPLKAQELLFYLLLQGNTSHTREALACVLWHDASDVQAKKYLRQCLWQLQQTLNPSQLSGLPLLHLEHEWVAVHPKSTLRVDTQQFEQAFVLVRGLDGATLHVEQAQVIQAATTLYRGELLSGWYQDWCLLERERYQSMFVAMLDKLMDFCQAQGQFDLGIAYGMRLLHLDYTRESTHRRLMQLYSAAGDRSGALRQFKICAAALEKEFGIQPTKRTRTLFDQICADLLGANRQLRATADTEGSDLDLLANVLAELSNIRNYVSALQHDMEQIKQALQQKTL